MRGELARIVPAIRRASKYDVPEWIRAHKRADGLPFTFEGIIPSPIIEGYRNKTEFTIGYVCVYVCVYVLVYVCMYVCVCVCVCLLAMSKVYSSLLSHAFSFCLYISFYK
jgi:hypothetical protein